VKHLGVLMKIALLSDENINVGDDIIREGTIYLLTKCLSGQKVEFSLVSVHDLSTLFTETKEDRILSADLIVVSGMPFYWYFSYAHKLKGIRVPFLRRLCSNPLLMEWTDEIWNQRIFKHKKKVMILGVGACQPYHDTAFDLISPTMEKFARETSERAIAITVRDNIASDYLSYYSIRHSKLPCPSIFGKKQLNVDAGKKEYVVINFMKTGGHYSFDYKLNTQNWIKTVERFYDWLTNEQNETVVFSCHDREEKEVQERYFPGATSFFSENYRDYVNFYAKAKLGFVNRVHAGYPIYSFKTPILVIGTDTRVKMTELIGMYHEFVNDITLDKLKFYYELFSNKHFDYEIIDETEERYFSLMKESLRRTFN
jgi:hypothetical protein